MFNYLKKYKDSYGEDSIMPNIPKIASHLAIVLVVIVLFFGSIGSVGAGQRGVLLDAGAVDGKVLSPGLYFKIPFYQSVVKLDVQKQKEEANASAASKDLQTVSSEVALNYSIQHEAVSKLYQDVGVDFKSRLIDPAIQESVKASTAKFTAEELITKREEVKEEIKSTLTTRLATNGIVVEDFSIINFDFSKNFNEAIEAKVSAEQNALAAKNKLAQVEYEAQQAIEEAKGKAEALRVESAAINSNPSIIQLRAIEKWDGHLPSTTGGAVPFINIK